MTDEQFKEIKEEFRDTRRLMIVLYFGIVICFCIQKCNAQDSVIWMNQGNNPYPLGSTYAVFRGMYFDSAFPIYLDTSFKKDTIYFRKDIITRNDSAFLNGEFIAGPHPFPDTVPWKPYYKPKKKKKIKVDTVNLPTWYPIPKALLSHKNDTLSFAEIKPGPGMDMLINEDSSVTFMTGGTGRIIRLHKNPIMEGVTNVSVISANVISGTASGLPMAQPKQDPWYKIKWPSLCLGISIGLVMSIVIWCVLLSQEDKWFKS